MNINSNCPFCKGQLTIKQTKESKKYFCENKTCQLNGSVRFKMFTRDDKITHLNFIIEEFMVSISYLDNTTGIASIKQEELFMDGIMISYATRASESEVIISEAPEIKFGELDKLYKKIKLWMTFL